LIKIYEKKTENQTHRTNRPAWSLIVIVSFFLFDLGILLNWNRKLVLIKIINKRYILKIFFWVVVRNIKHDIEATYTKPILKKIKNIEITALEKQI
jgi:hypothetical protein